MVRSYLFTLVSIHLFQVLFTVEVLDTNDFAIKTDTNFIASSEVIQIQSQGFADAAR